MDMIKGANLGLRFLLELCGLAAFAYWGFHTGGAVAKIALGVGAPVAMAVIWGLFVAPRARFPLPFPTSYVLGLVILELSALALAAAGQRSLAIVFAVVVLINAILLFVWRPADTTA